MKFSSIFRSNRIHLGGEAFRNNKKKQDMLLIVLGIAAFIFLNAVLYLITRL